MREPAATARLLRRGLHLAAALGALLLFLELWSHILPTVWTGIGIGAGLDGGLAAVEWWDPSDSEFSAQRTPGWLIGHNDFAMFGWFGWREYPCYRVIEVHLIIPIVAAAAGAVALALLTRRAERRFLAGHCRFCRYDLRGLPAPAPAAPLRCPECGRDSPSPDTPIAR